MNIRAELFVDSRCELGEGPFWHPLLDRLFWFDILNRTMLSADADGRIVDRVVFKDTVAAAAVIDKDHLAVAQSGVLLNYDLTSDTSTPIIEIESDIPGNRTNDSRVDPSGGFWIGTMGRRAEAGAGSVYQYKSGKLTRILSGIRIPNSTCFSPDGRTAYFTDAGRVIIKCALDPETGLPIGEWTEFATIEGPGGADGAVVDSEGFLWSARWGGSRVVRMAPDGRVDRIVEVPGVSRVSCPAFGGKDGKTLYLTTAREGASPEELAHEPYAGSVFAVQVDVPGSPDPLLAL